jgi:D-beta-D-heptose 7-phosphate kinase/D-beta-D-heptose 1-phosphate adenosyltransferase
MSNRQHLLPVIESLPATVVACVGDVMLDHFVHGDVNRISPEAPIPVLRIHRREFMLGGAGNAVRNLSSLGCQTWFFSVAGDDEEAGKVAQLLAALPGNLAHLERESGRQTPVKTRYIAHGQQLLRADSETASGVQPASATKLLAAFSAALPQCSIVLLSDYAKGVLVEDYAQEFIRVARSAGKPVIVDPKGRDFSRYRGASVIKPNLKELGEATGLPVSGNSEQEAAARKLLRDTEAEYILVTRGAEGMMLMPADGRVLRFPSMAREVYDVSGAGDTVAAVLAAALGSGAPIAEAVEVANIAAGIVVSKSGTAVVERLEILDEVLYRQFIGAGSKILQLAQACELAQRWAQRGWTIALALGSFDVLNPGHLKVLETARSRCDRLLVALKSDEYIRRTEGGSGPEQSELARSLVLASLRCVDGVMIFNETAPRELIHLLRPNLIVKGGEHDFEDLDGVGDAGVAGK